MVLKLLPDLLEKYKHYFFCSSQAETGTLSTAACSGVM